MSDYTTSRTRNQNPEYKQLKSTGLVGTFYSIFLCLVLLGFGGVIGYTKGNQHGYDRGYDVCQSEMEYRIDSAAYRKWLNVWKWAMDNEVIMVDSNKINFLKEILNEEMETETKLEETGE